MSASQGKFTAARRAFAVVVALALPALAGACVDGGMTPTMAAWDAVSVINTQKTVGDHLVGWYKGKDCSTVRAYYGGAYCQERYINHPPPPQEMYCYRSLGNITCYTKPVASASPDQLVNSPISADTQLLR